MQIAAAHATPQDVARDRLAIAARCLRPTEDVSAVHATSLALQSLLEAGYATKGEIAAAAPAEARHLSAMLTDATPRLVEALDGKILPARTYFLMGCARGLLDARDDAFWWDRVDYAAILAAELASIHHSESLVARGFPMLRAIRSNLAMAEPRDPNKPLN